MPISTNASALRYIRGLLGDLREGGDIRTDPILTDSDIDYLYDNKAGEDVDKTVAYALQTKCASLSSKVAKSDSDGGFNTQYQQERESICALAAEWAAITGINLGLGAASIQTGEMSLGIDEESIDIYRP